MQDREYREKVDKMFYWSVTYSAVVPKAINKYNNKIIYLSNL